MVVQPVETQFPLMLLIAALSIITLVGVVGRKQEESDMPRYELQTKMVAFSAVATLLLVLFVLIGFPPPGMDPAVPFIFVIPWVAFVMVLLLPVEVAWKMHETYIDRLAHEVAKQIEKRQEQEYNRALHSQETLRVTIEGAQAIWLSKKIKSAITAISINWSSQRFSLILKLNWNCLSIKEVLISLAPFSSSVEKKIVSILHVCCSH
ncbi:MAG: hypothetical protein KGY80_04520 [Candidatus Thorarchaeota archaeon]|nr:hypothetical protein [Candidatus Thorarchaeota archaeon]